MLRAWVQKRGVSEILPSHSATLEPGLLRKFSTSSPTAKLLTFGVLGAYWLLGMDGWKLHMSRLVQITLRSL